MRKKSRQKKAIQRKKLKARCCNATAGEFLFYPTTLEAAVVAAAPFSPGIVVEMLAGRQ